MPLLLVKGAVQGARQPSDAGPCEWCGEPMVARKPVRPEYAGCLFVPLDDDEPRYWTHPPMADPGAYDSASVILTRLCHDCSRAVGVMGDEGVCELPED